MANVLTVTKSVDCRVPFILLCFVFVYSAQSQSLLTKTNLLEFVNETITLSAALPPYLNGILVKNGPALFQLGNTSQTHLFDGFSKLNKFHFNNNVSILFTTKFLNSLSYRASTNAKEIQPYLQFGPRIPAYSTWESIQALLRGADNVNVNVICMNEVNPSCAALSDFWNWYEFNIHTLATVSRIIPPLPQSRQPFSIWHELSTLSSAHPLQVYNSTNLINLVWTVNPTFLPGRYNGILLIVLISTLHQRKLLVSVELPKISYIHSFGLSENFMIIFIDPLFVEIKEVVKYANLHNSIKWKPKNLATAVIANVHTGQVRKLAMNTSCVHLHHVNAFERNGYIFVDVVSYEDAQIFNQLFIKNLQQAFFSNVKPPSLRRYKIDLARGTVDHVPFLSRTTYADGLDFPKINEHFRFHNYCYIYGLVQLQDSHNVSRTEIVKKDVCRSYKDLSWYKTNHYPSEATFVANPRGQAEDDGVLVSVVLDGNRNISYVLVLDAGSLTTLSTGYLSTFIPFTVHGLYLV